MLEVQTQTVPQTLPLSLPFPLPPPLPLLPPLPLPLHLDIPSLAFILLPFVPRPPTSLVHQNTRSPIPRGGVQRMRPPPLKVIRSAPDRRAPSGPSCFTR